MTINDYAVGDILIVTLTGNAARREVEHPVEVTAVNYNGNGLVTYSGNTAGQSAFDPTLVCEDGTCLHGLRRWGKLRIVKTGKRVIQWKPYTPKPGDRSYDLMS
jgi:hypothetical protein